MGKVDGKIALITGGNSGIGLTTAKRFVQEGVYVFITGWTQSKSVVGSKGLPANSVYAATKAAARSFARTWTTDLKARRIRVNAISPGPIDTEGLRELVGSAQAGQDRLKCIGATVPVGRMGNRMRSSKLPSSWRRKTAASLPESSYLSTVASRWCRGTRPGLTTSCKVFPPACRYMP
jgi:NAD(P)-dependent dehydrogenase (short-subunit alcohol dehydrogenase family)